jgi:maltooligosyltrehalose trehalohydrolase
MLFQGEEWAASAPFQYFTDVDDEAVGNAVREGRRAEFAAFGWDPDDVPDPQDPETWNRSRLRWDERTEAHHQRILDWYRRLIALRAEHTDLRDGRAFATTVHHQAGSECMVIERGTLSVIVNLGEPEPVEIRADATVVLANGEPPSPTVADDGGWRIVAGRDQVIVLLHAATP